MEKEENTEINSLNSLIGIILWMSAFVTILLFNQAVDHLQGGTIFTEAEGLELIARGVFYGLIFLTCGISGTYMIKNR